MHELSLAQKILSTVLPCLEGKERMSVNCVNVNVGVLSGVVPHALDNAYSELIPGTILEGSFLRQSVVSATLLCSSCNKEFETSDFMPECPYCNSKLFTVIGGTDITVESIELNGD